MTSDDFLVLRAKELREQGLTYREIARHEDIRMSERTVYRWVSGGGVKSRKRRGTVVDRGADPWPDWSIDDLVDMHEGDESYMSAWRDNLALIDTARDLGRTYTPRFFFNLVTQFRIGVRPPGQDWPLALAGLPILADWLGEPAAEAVVKAIIQCQPWVGRNQRRIYQRAVADHTEALKAALYRAQATETARKLSGEPTEGPQSLAALSQRTPMFDRRPLFSELNRMPPGMPWLSLFSSVEER